MLDFGFYNMDCMVGMKEFPDKFFDLAIVDPPYGDAGGGWTNGERFGQRFDRYRHNSEGGWHGKQKYKTSCHLRAPQRSESTGLVEDGRTNWTKQKNHRVGRGSRTGLL